MLVLFSLSLVSLVLMDYLLESETVDENIIEHYEEPTIRKLGDQNWVIRQNGKDSDAFPSKEAALETYYAGLDQDD